MRHDGTTLQEIRQLIDGLKQGDCRCCDRLDSELERLRGELMGAAHSSTFEEERSEALDSIFQNLQNNLTLMRALSDRIAGDLEVSLGLLLHLTAGLEHETVVHSMARH
jgi:hypothetical protein